MVGCANSYPIEILPYHGYKVRVEIGELLERYPDSLVVRQVEGEISNYYLEISASEMQHKSCLPS